MASSWTIRDVLQWTAKDFASRGLDSPRLDAELLVAHALGLKRVDLYLDLDRPLTEDDRGRVRALIQRRRAREPVAYILGYREFFGRTFEVNDAVLIPRPDTETLVELAITRLPMEEPARAADLGVGCGAIAVSIAAERAQVSVDATDVSARALDVARRNAERHEVRDRVHFHEGDLLDPLPAEHQYAVIAGNPPYIPDTELDALPEEISTWEPREALAGGEDGLTVLRRLVQDVRGRLAPEGCVFVEVGSGQAPAVRELFVEAGFEGTRAHKDLAGVERVVEAWDAND